MFARVGIFLLALCCLVSILTSLCLTYGTDIEQAIAAGYSVLVASPNLHCYSVDARYTVYQRHVTAIFTELMPRCPAAFFDCIAFSYGGVMATALIDTEWLGHGLRARRVVFVDSVHSISSPYRGPRCIGFLQCCCAHFRASELPLGAHLPDEPNDSGCGVQCSAGTEEHEHTPASALLAVFDYLAKNFEVDPEILALVSSLSC